MSTQEPADPALAFLAGGGELGERLRSFDWSSNPLGPPAGWPQSLKTAVRIMLTSRQPLWVGWGPELIYLYNDPYRAIVGGKHPEALGRPTRSVWREIEDVIEPMLRTAMSGDEGTYVESQLLIMERHGYREETYYTFSYSPIPDDDGSPGGILCANTDDTQRVIGERQLALLRELAARTADARTWQDACERGVSVLSENTHDLPFSLLYLADSGASSLSLAASVGFEPGHPAAPPTVPLSAHAAWPLAEALRSREMVPVRDLVERFGSRLPTGAWPEPPRHAVVVPIPPAGPTSRAGALVVGLNPLRRLDDGYRRFLGLIAGQLASSLTSAQAYEEERERAEALAELDRAKTTFFSNVSHEFRTPLTLMLGPVEDLLGQGHDVLDPAVRAQLELVHRNSLRLLKLVNTMLDFSRIEAGRMQANFEPVRLASLTSELASAFRAAIERAGLRLVVDCPPLSERVYVDRDMWEKIVLNLLSNALKFTMEGEIRVQLTAGEGHVELTVSDTGVGIPPSDVDRVFDRFHRVADARGRTHEGTGIGLSLVQELARLHGGSVHVHSEDGRGSTFAVVVPLGKLHLDPERVRSGASPSDVPEASRAEAFVEEALRWMPKPEPDEDGDAWARSAMAAMPPSGPLVDSAPQPRVLLADDNADMREYVRRLLADRFDVEVVGDGHAALEAIRRAPPDLVLTDIMMPRLDGFELLTAIRSDTRLRRIPVVMLSARAGEEARVEGLERGADDYVTKPFTARELLARVSAQIEMARMQREVNAELREQEARLRLALQTGRLGAWELDLSTRALEYSPQLKANFGLPPEAEPSYEDLMEMVHPDDQALVRSALDRAIELHADYAVEYRVVWPDGSIHWAVSRGRMIHDAAGVPTHLTGVTQDVTERRQAEEALRASERWFRMMADTAPTMLWITDPEGVCTFLSRGWYDFTGQTEAEALGFGWLDAIHPDDRERSGEAFRQANATHVPFAIDYRLARTDGNYRWSIDTGRPRFSEGGEFLGFIGSVIDVHERKQAEEALKQADRRKDEFLATLAHELRNPLAPMRTGLELMKVAQGDAALMTRVRDTMERQLVHVVRLVDDLLDVSRISRGKIQLRTERVALAAVVGRAVETAAPGYDKAGQQLGVSLPERPVYVSGDPTRLLQIVGNLLSNACKYTPRGGSISVVIDREGDQARIRVRDTGIGLAPDQLDAVFEMFTQVHGPRVSRGSDEGGLGIGLTLVESLVKLHGGTVRAASEGLGHGSEFTVRLPLLAEAAATGPAGPGLDGAGASPAARPEGHRILVVDDNRDAAETLVMLLESVGHTLEVAFSGEQALEVAERFRPETVFLDIGMPGIDGYEACRRLRERPWAQHTRIAALTGWGQAGDRKKSTEAGFDHHLVKPIDLPALQQIIGQGPRNPPTA